MSASFLSFAQVADAVGATPKRLEKARLVGAWLSGLDDDDLRRAVVWLSGRVFPQCDQRTVQVGGRSLFRVLEERAGTDLRQQMVGLGDLGDLARAVLPEQPARETLESVERHFAELSGLSGSLERYAALRSWLADQAPLEARYVVKLLSGDLRIGLQEGAVEDALARLCGVPVGQVQWANMLLGDVGDTAVLARHGRLHEARMRLFHPLKFMLATPAATLDDVARQMPPEFVVEDKYDGIRGQVHVGPDESAAHGRVLNGMRVAIFSRTLDDITESFPEIVETCSRLSDAVILDGEILPVDGERIRPFADLQKRLGRKVLTPAMLAAVPVSYVAYDVLYAQGAVRLDEPFSARRARLEALDVRRAPSKRFVGSGDLDAEFSAARARGNEGLLVKDPGSTYKPGRRGREWLKIKRAMATLDVVVTAVEVGHGKRAHMLSDYTFAVRASETDGTLLNVGKAYSGLTDREILDLGQWFEAHTVEAFGHGRYRIVEPHVVLEVTFDAVQPSQRHKSGFALRFPRIVRRREDKPASDV
ncbi:MAG TPA: DNA ligase, partial [Candidatus Xenobia bacterium]